MKPIVLASTVIRNTEGKDHHGELHLIDLEKVKSKCVFKLKKEISLEGRGTQRGLRGICFYKDLIYVGIFDGLIVFDNKFNVVDTHTDKKVMGCHEIDIHDNKIYLTATLSKSIVVFNIDKQKFTKVYQCPGIKHMNSICVHKDKLYYSGLHSSKLLSMNLDGSTRELVCKIPKGTHNVLPIGNKNYIMNHTTHNRILKWNNGVVSEWSIPYIPNAMANRGSRAGFARGLCKHGNLIIGGCSPATVSWTNMRTGKSNHIQIRDEVNNGIHGLEVLPNWGQNDK